MTTLEALVNLFQTCQDLPLDEMKRMEREINDASLAIIEAGVCGCGDDCVPMLGEEFCVRCALPLSAAT